MNRQNIEQLLSLSDKVALVTGAGSGIGAGIALRLAESGAAVMVSDIDGSAADAVAAQIRERGGTAQSQKADAGSVSEAQRVIQATVEAFGGMDVLVNNAGIFPFVPLLDMDEATWDRVLDINLKGAFFHTQVAARQMIKQGRGGRIINVASVSGFKPVLGLSHYDATKAAIVMMTKSHALELAPHNITVNAIAPGAVLTEGVRRSIEAIAAAVQGTPEQFIQGYIDRIPLHRLGTPDDIARMVLCLATTIGDYMTGHTVLVDGGLVFA